MFQIRSDVTRLATDGFLSPSDDNPPKGWKWTCSDAMCLKIVAFAAEHGSHNAQNKADKLGDLVHVC